LPVSFRRLHIAGFKSFAEPVTVDILPGLTGIVGPNGCGKSNVVEALRWAMGEASARNLRGGEMDDIIFAGTAGRAARDVAEVSLYLEDTVGVAPPPLHDEPDIQIVRRIERGSGSVYKVNGREFRARDVQTLFADLASGARASAMVSQGRVGALVSARPVERRAVLEEAAGITGLHARRHEADLKLKAAETNLARAEDARGQLENQLGGLKRQARQAARYRNLSEAIRAAEAESLSILAAITEAARASAHADLLAARDAVVALTAVVAAASRRAEHTAAALPAARDADAATRGALERQRIALEQTAAEEERARATLADAQRRLEQLRRDLEHGEQIRRDAVAAEERLAAEDAALAAASTGYEQRVEAANAAAAGAVEAASGAETAATRATEASAAAIARAQAAEQNLAQAARRAQVLAQQLTRLRTERAAIVARAVDPEQLALAAGDATRAETEAAALRTALEAAEAARTAALAALAAARDTHAEADSRRARLAAETAALAEVLAVKEDERWPPVLDSLTVPRGLEAALGAALGEELTAALDPETARHWRDLPPDETPRTLPNEATPLADLMSAPAALSRALSQIGVLDDDNGVAPDQAALSPGQTLVSRAGALWRWDGFTMRAGTPTPAAVRLRQRNRLALLRDEHLSANDEAATTRQRWTEADNAAKTASAAEQRLRGERREMEQRLERVRAALATLRAQDATAAARLSAMDEQLARVTADAAEADAALRDAQAASRALPDIAAMRVAAEQARAALTDARQRESSARGQRDGLIRDHAGRAARRRTIVTERANWRDRARDATDRVTDMTARLTVAEAEYQALAAAPQALVAAKAAAAEGLAEAESAHRAAAAALEDAVSQANEAEKDARAADSRLTAQRVDAVRAEGAGEQADQAVRTLAERIIERLGPDPVLPDAPEGPTLDLAEQARKRFDRLQRERESIGAVNLRAEAEVGEIERQIATIERERDEITTAIARLRGSIGHLNREGRERLSAVLHQIDTGFQHLFARMFGGGRAHLALVGSDDPLEAGLEIYAQPPGKQLATLSLLSGGEQALTALSLIFAVFRCNPAPICVLDEVDAPLDDANVDRFCTLLDDMVKETGTRFLVVTHHPLTMGRMDRLYGVTMQERGVSRVLSVDLERAAAMVEGDAGGDRRLAAE